MYIHTHITYMYIYTYIHIPYSVGSIISTVTITVVISIVYRSLGVVSDKLAQLSATPYKREILRRRRRRRRRARGPQAALDVRKVMNLLFRA